MADFEVRQGGMVVASVSGPEEQATNDAWHYFHQYAPDATEDAPVELVRVIPIAIVPEV